MSERKKYLYKGEYLSVTKIMNNGRKEVKFPARFLLIDERKECFLNLRFLSPLSPSCY